MTDTLANGNGLAVQGTSSPASPPTGKARGRQVAPTEPKKHRKQVSLYEDTQALIWEASDRLGMENDPVVKAALKLLLRDCERRGIRRKTNDEMIAEIVDGES